MRETMLNLSVLQVEYERHTAKLREIGRRYTQEANPVIEALRTTKAELERRWAQEWQLLHGRQPVDCGDVAVPVAPAEAAPEPVPNAPVNAQAKAQGEAKTWRTEQLKCLAASIGTVEE